MKFRAILVDKRDGAWFASAISVSYFHQGFNEMPHPVPDDMIPSLAENSEVETATDHYHNDGLALLIDPETGRIHTDVAELQPCPLCGQDNGKPLVVRQGFPYVRCGDCGMIYMSPRLKDNVYEKRLRADEELRDQFHAFLAQQPENRAERVLKSHLVRLKMSTPRGKLLDLNCGLGDFMILARGAGYVVSGIELHNFAASHARGNGLFIYQDPLHNLHLSPQSIDVVTALDVLGREQHPVQLLHLIRGVLKPRGRLLVTCPNVESLACQALGLEKVETLRAPDQINWFNRETLRRMLGLGGFKVVELNCLANKDLDRLLQQMEQNGQMLSPFILRILAQKENEGLRQDLSQILQDHWLGSWLLAECEPA